MAFGGGKLSRGALPGFGSTSLQRPETPGSGLPGFQIDLNHQIGNFTDHVYLKINNTIKTQLYQRNRCSIIFFFGAVRFHTIGNCK